MLIVENPTQYRAQTMIHPELQALLESLRAAQLRTPVKLDANHGAAYVDVMESTELGLVRGIVAEVLSGWLECTSSMLPDQVEWYDNNGYKVRLTCYRLGE